MAHPEALRKAGFELGIEAPGGEPKIERAIDQGLHVRSAIDLARYRHCAGARNEGRWGVEATGIFADQIENGLAQRGLIGGSGEG